MKAIRELQAFMHNPVDFLAAHHSDGLPIKKVELGPLSSVLVYHPSLVKEVLASKGTHFSQNKSVFKRLTPITGKKGLVQLEGKLSKEFRAISLELFRPENMQNYSNVIKSITNASLDSIKTEDELHISEFMTGLVLKTAIAMFLGIQTDKVDSIAKKFLELNQLCGKRMLSPMPMPILIPTKGNSKIRKLSKELRKEIISCLDEDFTQYKTVANLFKNDETKIDQCLTFLFAGHETTASSIAFTLLLLAKNPEYQRFIISRDKAMSKSIYNEALRLYPPAYMLVREANRNTSLGGVQIKKGEKIFIALREIHRDEQLFFQPKAFYPERFFNKQFDPFTFFPFGKGAKSCVGEKLAYLEADIILSAFCKRFIISTDMKAIKANPLVTLHPDPSLTLSLKEREISSSGVENVKHAPAI